MRAAERLLKARSYRRLRSRRGPLAIYAAYDKMKQGRQAKLIWGPLRHGAGHNVAFYVYDYTGTIVEYSAEEEIILNDGNYAPRSWPVTDPYAADEWNRSHIPDAMM
jgi:catechol 2,3-dioxygenase